EGGLIKRLDRTSHPFRRPSASVLASNCENADFPPPTLRLLFHSSHRHTDTSAHIPLAGFLPHLTRSFHTRPSASFLLSPARLIKDQPRQDQSDMSGHMVCHLGHLTLLRIQIG
ncbi:unnamed protein product, partial [Protopolystoma xenopodis]